MIISCQNISRNIFLVAPPLCCKIIFPFRLIISLKAHSHSLKQSANSAVDCVNAEIGIFLSLCINATVCCTAQHQMQLGNVNEPQDC